MGKLYLIPNTLGDTPLSGVIPSEVIAQIKALTVFASENPKDTRRYLKKIDKTIDLDTLTILPLNEHSTPRDIEAFLPHLSRTDVGIISEAGCPGIADPGAGLVALAHRHGHPVIPLVGPSSILLALIASGFSGQAFSFNGYLPVKTPERIRALKAYEKQSAAEHRTQLFIETPYRNLKLLREMLQTLRPDTLLSIACDLTTPAQYIRTLPIRTWRALADNIPTTLHSTPNTPLPTSTSGPNILPDLHKRPAIFSIYAVK